MKSCIQPQILSLILQKKIPGAVYKWNSFPNITRVQPVVDQDQTKGLQEKPELFWIEKFIRPKDLKFFRHPKWGKGTLSLQDPFFKQQRAHLHTMDSSMEHQGFITVYIEWETSRDYSKNFWLWVMDINFLWTFCVLLDMVCNYICCHGIYETPLKN